MFLGFLEETSSMEHLSGRLLKTQQTQLPQLKDGVLKLSGQTFWFVVQEHDVVVLLVGSVVTMPQWLS
jgi:hypothetical protein